MAISETDRITALLDAVDQDGLRADVLALERLERRAEFENSGAAADWVRESLIAAGYARDQVHFIQFPHARIRSNVLFRPAQFSKPAILIGAHYDSITTDGGRAPGADDNASGLSALLELGRLLQDASLSHDVLLAAFGAEEVGLAGSRHLAMLAAAQRWPLVLMINLDMVAFPTRAGRVVIECEPSSNVTPFNDASVRAFGSLMAEMARTYTSLQPEFARIRLSDHLSFEDIGVPALGVYEGEGNPCRHRQCDTSATLDFDYLSEVVKMVLATLLWLGR